MTTALEKLLSSRLVSLSICGHAPYPLFMAPPPPPLTVPVALSASPPHQQERQQKQFFHYQEGAAVHRGQRFGQQLVLTDIASLHAITVAEAIKSLEEEGADRPMGQCSPSTECGFGAGSGTPSRRRRRPTPLAEDMMPVDAVAPLAAPYLAEMGSESARSERLGSMDALVHAQQSPFRNVNADDLPPGAATAAPPLKPSAAKNPSVAIANERRRSPCSPPSHGSLSKHPHDEAAAGHIDGSGSDQNSGEFQAQRRRHDAMASAAICKDVDGSGAVGEGMVPERVGSGVPSTPGLAHCGCHGVLEGDNPTGPYGYQGSPSGGGYCAGTRGGIEHMDIEVTVLPTLKGIQPGPNGNAFDNSKESANGEDGEHAGPKVHGSGPPGTGCAQAATIDGQDITNHCHAHPAEAHEATAGAAIAVCALDAVLRGESSQGEHGSGSGYGANGYGHRLRRAVASGCMAAAPHAEPVRAGVSSSGRVSQVLLSSSEVVEEAVMPMAAATAAAAAAIATGPSGDGRSCVASATCRKTAQLNASAATTSHLGRHAAARTVARANGATGTRVAAAAAINAVAGVLEAAAAAAGDWHSTGTVGAAGTMRFALGLNDAGAGAGASAGGARAPPLLSGLAQLVSLTLAADLGFPSPQHLEAITSLRNLQKLDMRGAKFMQVEGDASLQARQAWLHVGNEHVAVVARCTSLTSLSLNHLHPVGGQQLVALTALNRLTCLGLTDALSGNTVHGSHIRTLAAGLPELRSLEVGRVTCPPLHLPQQQPGAALPPGSAGPAAAAATTGAAGPNGGDGGARQPPLPPSLLPLPQPQQCGVAGGTRASSPSASWPYCQSWGPVLGLFHGLTSLHLQVACSFETELLNGVAALPLLDNFSMELLDVPPPQLAAILQVLAAAAPGPGACIAGACGDGGDLPGAAVHRRGPRRASVSGITGGDSFNGSLSYVFHGLTLTACMLYDEHLELMGRLGHLRYIRLDQVDIRTRDPDGWTALSGAHALESFSFRAWNNPILSASNLCVLTNDSLAMMAANWPRLQQLSYCGKVALTEKAEEHLARMTCLTSLEITGTDGTSIRVWRSTATGKLLRTIALPHTTAAKVSSRNGYVTYSDSDDSADEGSEASVNWMGEIGYVTSEYDAD
ncbi:hypothetical protein Vretimale_11940 [Volvox reticuliferus]|nr:hypothetical protein Vretimale_11940 [Volvox reticuliferus]